VKKGKRKRKQPEIRTKRLDFAVPQLFRQVQHTDESQKGSTDA